MGNKQKQSTLNTQSKDESSKYIYNPSCYCEQK